MKFKDILQFADDLIGDNIPVVGVAIDAINLLLPQDQKLNKNASVKDIKQKFNGLNGEQQLALLQEKLNYQIHLSADAVKTQEILARVDEKGASTRPFIALLMAWSVALTVTPVAWVFAYAIVTQDADTIASISENYLMLLAILGVPAAVVSRYFGLRTADKNTRQTLAHGYPPSSSFLQKIFLK